MEHNYYEIKKNVKIRPLCIDDIEKLRQWRNNPENTKYLKKIPVISVEGQKKWFEKDKVERNEFTFAIEEIEKLHRMVGSVSLYNIVSDQAEIGKILIGDPEAHGKQVGVNAIRAVIEIAFEKLGVKQLILHCYKENLIALKVYQKVGFVVLDEDNKTEEYTMVLEKELYKDPE